MQVSGRSVMQVLNASMLPTIDRAKYNDSMFKVQDFSINKTSWLKSATSELFGKVLFSPERPKPYIGL